MYTTACGDRTAPVAFRPKPATPRTPPSVPSKGRKKALSPFKTPPLRPCSPLDVVDADELVSRAYELGLKRLKWTDFHRIRTLGKGAFTVAFLATGVKDGKPVVIKRLRSDARCNAAAVREIATETSLLWHLTSSTRSNSTNGDHVIKILGAGHVPEGKESNEDDAPANAAAHF